VPRRVAVNILNESWGRIRVEGYFAVTSNTAQFGARAELFFGFSGFGIEGHIAFDALFQFSPFFFIVEISGSLSLKAFGVGLLSIRLQFSLEGPTPWRAKGKGSVSILFFEIEADFDVTWGESQDTTLPPVEVMPILEQELTKNDSWTAILPSSNNLLVSLRTIDATEELVLHPVGGLRVSQRAVPLDLELDKVGDQKPSDVNRLSLDVAAGGLTKLRDVREKFAPGRFKNLSDALTTSAFEDLTSGVELSVSGKQVRSSQVVKRVARYEMIIIDSNYKKFVQFFFVFVATLFAHFLKGAAVTKSELSHKHRRLRDPLDDPFKVVGESFVVARTDTNQAMNETARFQTQVEASDFMQQALRNDPTLSGGLHVIPSFEEAA